MERAAVVHAVKQMQPVDMTLYYPRGDQRAFWDMIKNTEAYKQDLQEIRQEGERLLSAPNPELTYSLFMLYEQQGSRLEYERVYFERRRRLNTFALLALLEPDRQTYKAALYDMISSICQEMTWCLPAHVHVERLEGSIDLFSAETGFTLSELLCLFESDLPSVIRNQVLHALSERLFKPFLTHAHHWETAHHNWSAVCGGAIGAAALLQLNDTELLASVLLKTERCVHFYLKGFGSDGACLEGLGYWNYGFGYFIYYNDLLRQRSHGEMDWLRHDKVRCIAQFQQKAFLGGNKVVNFSDTLQEGSVHIGLSHYLAKQVEAVQPPPSSLRAAYTNDHCSRWAPAFRNLIWRDYEAEDIPWEVGSYYLPDAQWLISRYQDETGIDFGFAAKGGSNDEPHNHNDLGQFLLYGAGQIFISELGCGEYTADYFGEGRYTYDCNGSHGHAVPIINGRLQAAGGAYRANVLSYTVSQQEDILHLDLTSAYEAAELLQFRRWLCWNKRGKRPVLELRDEMELATPGSVIERFITTCRPECTGQGKVRLHGETRLSLQLHYNDELLEPVIQTKSYRNHFGMDTSYTLVDFILKQPAAGMSIAFQFEFAGA